MEATDSRKPLILSLALVSFLFLDGCKKEIVPSENLPAEGYAQNEHEVPVAFPDQGEILSFYLEGDTVTFRKIDTLYVYQGDIVYTQSQLEEVIDAKGATMPRAKYWPGGVVFYEDYSNLPNSERISTAMDEYEEKTLIRFVKRTNETNYIEFVRSHCLLGTHAWGIGMTKGKQKIYIMDHAKSGDIIHEIGHKLGLLHEMCRSDRDQYIVIHGKNIKKNKEQYKRVKKSINLTPFDCYSVMMYPSYDKANAKDPSKPVMESRSPLPDGKYTWDFNRVLSPLDILAINKLYGYTPKLYSPPINEILDNGCYDKTNVKSWFFDWSDCPGATKYNLYLKGTAPDIIFPVLDIEITESEYHFDDFGYVADKNRLGWTWKVRALIAGEWEEWSEIRTFDIEPLNTDCTAETVTDIDGNIYKTVEIGTQVWLKENLKTTKYNDGSEIFYKNGSWLNITSPVYCWYNDDINNKNIYGGLYNWYTVNTGMLCPAGWHVPDNSDLIILSDFLGGRDLAGGHLKEEGTDHWISPNTGADNSTGFTALPGGIKNYFPEEPFFGYIGYFGFWWARSVKEDYAYSIAMYNTLTMLYNIPTDKRQGLSIRCIKD